MPHVGDVAGEKRIGRRPVGLGVIGDPPHGGALPGIGLVPKRRLIVHPVGGIGHHQARVGPGEELGDVRRRRRVAAREAVAAELEHVAAPDCGRGGRGQHGVLVGLRLRPLRGEEPGKLLGRPEGLQGHARLFELPQHGRIPVQVEFGNPVVG